MKIKVSEENPFEKDRYIYLWEVLKCLKPDKHLDYGAYDGEILKVLFESRILETADGVDLNKDIVEKSKSSMPAGISLEVIEKKEKLPFDDEYFCSVSILDVIEHIHDQKSVLLEINRVLKKGGKLIITVPRKNIFSFLDLGNLKFIFPKIHKAFVCAKYSPEVYEERYANNKSGLFGDIEVEKMWHQHFTSDEMGELLGECGFKQVEFDGAGLFLRPLFICQYLLPFTKACLDKLIFKDACCFEKSNLFALATKE